MSKFSKQEARLHNQACELLKKDVLTYDDKLFVLENWQEGAVHFNGLAGAFFTPQPLAQEFAIELTGVSGTVIDLCAGIGSLAFAVLQHNNLNPPKITCVEINPDYVAVGRKIVPEATWIAAGVLDLPEHFGKKFAFAIANPPFGRSANCKGRSPRYKGQDFEYKVMDIASDLANYGVFLIPQGSSSFMFSGKQHFQNFTSEKYEKFVAETGITIQPNCGIDTMACDAHWHGVKIVTEIVNLDFRKARELRDATAKALTESESVSEPTAVSEQLAEHTTDCAQQPTLFAL